MTLSMKGWKIRGAWAVADLARGAGRGSEKAAPPRMGAARLVWRHLAFTVAVALLWLRSH